MTTAGTPSTRWQRDGWDADVRLGLLTPAADVGPEAEIGAMVPPDVSVHAARVRFAAMRAGGAMDPTIALEAVRRFSEPPEVDERAAVLASAPVDVIGFGFTSSAYVIGVAGEEAFVERLATVTRGIPVVSTGQALPAALRAVGASRIALVSPPWFDATLTEHGRSFFEEAGFEVAFAASCDLPSEQAAITPEGLHDWVVGNVPLGGGVEAIAVGGNGFRAVGVIDALERATGRPVVTANQALLWACLGAAGHEAAIPGYGRLLAGAR